MKKPPPESITAELERMLPRKGFAPWYATAPADVMQELEAIRERFHAGQLAGTKTGISNTLSRILQARGIKIGHAGVAAWLAAKP